MVENLNGNQVNVNLKSNSNIRLYTNGEYEECPSHWITPLEVIVPLQSKYSVTYCKTVYTLNEGDVLVINPGIVNGIHEEFGKRLILQADFELLHNIKELEDPFSIISPVLLITAEDIPESCGQLQVLMREISDEYFSGAPLSEALIYSKLIELFVIIGRSYAPTVKCVSNGTIKQKEYTERFMHICDYIMEHFSEDLSLDEVANISGFSKYHFSRLFKQFTNLSFYKYLNKKRIENAEKLLINHDLTITEVALRCGFSSVSSFIRMFKIVKGCTPSEFKTLNAL